MVDLQAYKQPWLDYCAAHGVTPSQALRQVIAKLLAGTFLASGGATGAGGKSAPLIRKEIRLTPDEVQAVEDLALREGFSGPRWIVALIRARLDNTPQLGQHELDLLVRSNLHILALGRSLNQIARILHTSPDGLAAVPPELVTGTADAVRAHAAIVSRVLAANQQRWRRS
ncbi:MAG: hypothetical protein V4723_07285 [Pseudomonadota bacterium]